MKRYINQLLLICLLSIPFLSAEPSKLDAIFDKAHARCRINPNKLIDGSNSTCMETLAELRTTLQERKKSLGADAKTAGKLHTLENSIHSEYVDAKKTNPLTSKNSKFCKILNWLTWGICNAGVVRTGDKFINQTIDTKRMKINDPDFTEFKGLIIPVIAGVINFGIDKYLNVTTEEMRRAHQEIKDIKTEYYGFTNPFDNHYFN